MNNSGLVEILTDFAALFFPRYCRGCDDALVRGEELICTRCMIEMPRSGYHLDPCNPFFTKFRGRIPVRYVMTLFKFVKGSRVQHLLHALKYRNQPELGVTLGRIYGQDLVQSDFRGAFDLIVPVPLHPSRRRSRGYNQSEEFGKGMGEILGVECTDRLMRRTQRTTTQTRRSRLKRWENVSSVFEVVRPDAIRTRRVLLVDDVVTTGATLEACGGSLVRAGCGELSIACIASTQ